MIKFTYLGEIYRFESLEEAKKYYLPDNYNGQEIVNEDDLQEFLKLDAGGLEYPRIIKKIKKKY